MRRSTSCARPSEQSCGRLTTLESLTAGQRSAIADDLVPVLAALHAAGPAEVGLDDFARHGDYCQRQLATWEHKGSGRGLVTCRP
jgi:aminoglycoside phosphotransferase (APT) family kinase protein